MYLSTPEHDSPITTDSEQGYHDEVTELAILSTVSGFGAAVAEVMHEPHIKYALLAVSGIAYSIAGYKIVKHDL